MGTSLAGDVLTTDGGSGIHTHTPRVSPPKGTPDKATFTIKIKRAKLEGNRCNNNNKNPFKRAFFTSRLFVCGIFPAHSLPLWRKDVIDNKEERRGEKEKEEAEWGFLTKFLNPYKKKKAFPLQSLEQAK